MILGYVSFGVFDGTICDTWFHVSHAIKLPDGRRFFRAEIGEIGVIVVSENPVQESNNWFSQVVHIYDRSFTLHYEEDCEIILRLNEKCNEYFSASVVASTPMGSTSLGDIKLFADGRVLYGGRLCDTNETMRLYSKVMMLVG